MKEKLLHFIDELERYLKDEEKKGMRYILGDFDSQETHEPTASAVDGGASPVLEEMEKKVSLCTRCALFSSRKNTVFGEGSPHADLVFVGEAPGADEDEQGRPFVGAAGQLLTKIIEGSFDLKREDVYICNILKCRPPGNRNPLPSEIVECREFVLKQIDTIRPKIICTLGSIATQALLETTEGITKLRGRFFDFRGTKLIPTFHPAYLLRNASKKREVWEDMKSIKKYLEDVR